MSSDSTVVRVPVVNPPCGVAGCKRLGVIGFGPPGWPKPFRRCGEHAAEVAAASSRALGGASPPRASPQTDLFGRM